MKMSSREMVDRAITDTDHVFMSGKFDGRLDDPALIMARAQVWANLAIVAKLEELKEAAWAVEMVGHA